jgi:hypothetical protein
MEEIQIPSNLITYWTLLARCLCIVKTVHIAQVDIQTLSSSFIAILTEDLSKKAYEFTRERKSP